MRTVILEWIRLIIGLLVFVSAFGLILWDIATGLKQTRNIKQARDKGLYKISLSPNYLDIARVGVHLIIFLVISLVIWKSSSTLGIVLLIGFLILGITWVTSRPKAVGIIFSDNDILLLSTNVKKIKSIAEDTRESDSIEIELKDSTGESTSLECEMTAENKKTIDLMKEKLLGQI